MTTDRSAYYQSWYATNRSGIREARRKRYASDPGYAEECRARSRAYRETQRQAREDKGWRVEMDGKQREAFTVRKLADGLGRSIQTINYWHRHGILPETPLRTPGKSRVRLYTEGMIKVVVSASRKRDSVARSDLKFGGEIRRGWSGLGAYQGTVIGG